MESAAMRKATATRVLVLFRFFFFTGLPPLFGTCGAKVTCETNCFSFHIMTGAPLFPRPLRKGWEATIQGFAVETPVPNLASFMITYGRHPTMGNGRPTSPPFGADCRDLGLRQRTPAPP